MFVSSRRRFLQSASAAAAVLSASRVHAWAQPSGEVRVWSTFRDRRHSAGTSLAWKPAGQISTEAIVLNPSDTRQQVLGFGTAMTDSACWVLSQLTQTERDAVLHDIFDPGEMAMNVCRTCIGASDYARNLYSFDESDEPDPELKKFSIDHDKEYILPVLRECRKHNPELFMF
jgi:glucosylceramidase